MASTFSPSLRIELIGDGDQSGIWGQTTNTNLGTLIEQGITGVQSITMVNANYTLSNFNGVSDEARNAVLVVGGTNTAQRDIIAPLVEKTYIVYNNTTGGFAIRIIGASGLGVTIPNGITAQVYCDGTNFYNALSGSVGNFTVNGNLAVTGTTSLTGVLNGSTAVFSGAISSVSPAFTGTPTAPTASPGTNTTQIATTAFVTAATGTLGTMSTQNANNVNITGGSITGITDLAVADGGTGASTFTSNNVVLGNGTSSLAGNMVAPGTSGFALRSTGTTWTSQRLGLGMTGEVWNDVLSSRNSGQTYTNSNGYPIMVAVAQQAFFQSHSMVVVVGGVTISNSGGGGNFYNGGQETSFIVPTGATYSVTFNGIGASSWSELY